MPVQRPNPPLNKNTHKVLTGKPTDHRRTDHRPKSADDDLGLTRCGDVRRPAHGEWTEPTDALGPLDDSDGVHVAVRLDQHPGRPNELTLSAALATPMSPDSAAWLTDAPLLTTSATTSRRTAVPGLLPANSCVSHSIGSSRRPCRPTKISSVLSHTKTTPQFQGLADELSHCSFTQLPTTAQRASHTHSQTLNVRLKRSLNFFCRFILRIFANFLTHVSCTFLDLM